MGLKRFMKTQSKFFVVLVALSIIIGLYYSSIFSLSSAPKISTYYSQTQRENLGLTLDMTYILPQNDSEAIKQIATTDCGITTLSIKTPEKGKEKPYLLSIELKNVTKTALNYKVSIIELGDSLLLPSKEITFSAGEGYTCTSHDRIEYLYAPQSLFFGKHSNEVGSLEMPLYSNKTDERLGTVVIQITILSPLKKELAVYTHDVTFYVGP